MSAVLRYRLASLAWIPLFAAIATVVLVARSHPDGSDFITSVWGPARGLLHGLNPYDPSASGAYLRRFHLDQIGGLYTPTALLLHAPLVALSQGAAGAAMARLNAVLLWVAVLVLLPPISGRACVVAAIAGSLIVFSATAQDAIFLGQLSPWALLGLAVLARTLGAPSVRWWPVVGLTLLSLKPQAGIPAFIVVALLGHWRVVVRAIITLTVTSIPGVGLALWAAGGLGPLLDTLRRNLAFYEHIPTNDLANSTNNRADLLGVVSHLGGPALNSAGWAVVALVMLSLALALLLWREAAAPTAVRLLQAPGILTAVSVFLLLALYHQPYDQLLLFASPLAAMSVSPLSAGPVRRIVMAMGALLFLFELAFRYSFRVQLTRLGFHEHTVLLVYFTIPTLIGVAATLGCTALLLARRRLRIAAPETARDC